MKIKPSFLIIPGLFLLLGTNLFAETGEELFKAKCTSCHSMDMPKSKADMLAPPTAGFMYHLNEHFNSNEELKEHILSFVINPTEDAAVCRSVRRFGLMPSQKDNISIEELKLVADWLINNMSISKKEYQERKRKMFAN